MSAVKLLLSKDITDVKLELITCNASRKQWIEDGQDKSQESGAWYRPKV